MKRFLLHDGSKTRPKSFADYDASMLTLSLSLLSARPIWIGPAQQAVSYVLHLSTVARVALYVTHVSYCF